MDIFWAMICKYKICAHGASLIHYSSKIINYWTGVTLFVHHIINNGSNRKNDFAEVSKI